MNVLKNYCLKVSNFAYKDIKRILDHKHDEYTIQRKGPQLYFIKSDNRLEQLKCISSCYTTNKDGKPIKIAKTNNKCFNTQLKFGITRYADCDSCHREALRLFERNLIHMTKNGK